MKYPNRHFSDALFTTSTATQQQWYNHFFLKVKQMVVANNGTAGDAADIFHDALLSVYYRVRQGSLRIDHSFEAFLYVVCYKKWLKELHRRKAQMVLTTTPQPIYSKAEDSIATMEAYLLHKQRVNLINEQFNALDEDCRKLLRLSWSGRSMHEVAALLGITYAYARKKKCTCMNKLRALVRQSAKFDLLK